MRRHVWSITFCLIILSLLSLFNILSLSIQADGTLSITDLFIKQLIFIAVGWGIYILLARSNYTLLKFPQFSILLYIVTIALLLATILWGPVINNTQRWLIFGEFQFQPSELAKITIILFTASIFTFRKRFNDLILMLFSLLALIPIVVIVYLQPHGSMSLIMILIWVVSLFSIMRHQLRNSLLIAVILTGILGVLNIFLGQITLAIIFLSALTAISIFIYYARSHWKKLLLVSVVVGLVLGVLVSVSWNSLLRDYQKERITAFFSPVETSQDVGFNVDQSRVAIGSGRIFGKGWGFGTQSKLQFLPEYQTDFVFAAFSEEFGLVGSFALISIYGFLVYYTLIHAFKNRGREFEYIFLTGVSIKIFLELFINIGTNTGMIPATGIPLPLMSVGGTSIIFFFFSLGLVQSIIASNFSDYKETEVYSVDNDEGLI
jgi:rod shape determining protein RodA